MNEDIASDVGGSAHTIKSWISVFVTRGIVYLLEPYHNKIIQRLTHMPKIKFIYRMGYFERNNLNVI